MKNEQLPQIVSNNIFYKIKNWFKNLIKSNNNTGKTIELVADNKNIKSQKKKFIEEMEIEDPAKILHLQRALEQKDIQISNLTDGQLNKMIKLYKNQIQQKKANIEKYKKIIFGEI